MMSLTLSSSPVYTKAAIKTPITHQTRAFCHVSPQVQPKRQQLGSLSHNPLRMPSMINQKKRWSGVVCYAGPLAPGNLQWISTISTAVLMLAKGTAIHKSFLVPLFALQAPGNFVSWMKGEYGFWAAFLALLVRLFFHIPGELELPFVTLLMIIVAPHEVMKLRGKQEGVILSLVIAGYLAYLHFSRTGSLQKAFDQGSILATVAIICIVVVPCLLLI